MNDARSRFETDCLALLGKYFASHPAPAMEKRAHKTLRMLRSSEKPLKGKPEGWAAGILYAVANDARIPSGVPGLQNNEFERFMGVSMGTARDRAVRVRELMAS